MKNEDLLKKWLSDDLSSIERKRFEASDDYSVHNIIMDTAKFFRDDQAPSTLDISAMREKLYLENNLSTGTKIWQSPWFKIAAMLVVLLGVGSFFLFLE